VLATKEGKSPAYRGIDAVLENENTDVKVFNKPSTRPYRRMAVVVCNDLPNADVNAVKEKAIRLSQKIEISCS
jgi:phosphoribosylglycinamide formyltransferase 2